MMKKLSQNCSILTYIYILVFKTSRGKQAVTEITDAKLLLRKRTLAEMGLAGTPVYCEG
jgi:hypothetical protein